MFGNILVIVALVIVAAILIGGLVVMAIGGETSNKWSNRLMRYRVLAQAVAIGILFLVLYFGTRN
jgi:tryptophan-rich sensory protein